MSEVNPLNEKKEKNIPQSPGTLSWFLCFQIFILGAIWSFFGLGVGVETDGHDMTAGLPILKYSKSNAFITEQIVYLSDKSLSSYVKSSSF